MQRFLLPRPAVVLIAGTLAAGAAEAGSADTQAVTPATAPLGTVAPVSAAWWTGFGDPLMSQLEEQALAHNLSLGMAFQQIAAARAELRVAGASGLPQAGASLSYQREQASPNGILSLVGADAPAVDSAGGGDAFGTTSASNTGGPVYNLFQAGFDARWELDLWGRARNTRAAARADAQQAAYDHEAAQVALTAEVARVYCELRGVEAEIDITARNRDNAATGLALARHREQAGATSQLDAAAADAQLQATDARLPLLRNRRDVLRNALALLVAQPPHALDELLDRQTPVPLVPADIPTVIPSGLARQRPDIAAADAALHAATARVKVAHADFYPSINLAGSAGVQALSLSNLPEWASRQFIVGPVLQLPIFTGGALTGRLEFSRANERSAALRYQQTVLAAWHEVDDALSAVRAQQARTAALRGAVAASEDAFHVADRRYRQGAAGYLDALVAERTLLANELALAQSRTADATAVIALYKALGGGWSPLRRQPS